MDETEQASWDEMADKAERGELRPIPGRVVRGPEAGAEVRAILLAETGAATIEEAIRIYVARAEAAADE